MGYSYQRIDDAGGNVGPALSNVPSGVCVLSAIIGARYGEIVLNRRLLSRPSGGALGMFGPTGQLTPDRVGLFARPDNVPDLFGNDMTGCVIVHTGVLDLGSIQGLQTALLGRWRISA
jgi:hypothetical protein